MSNELSTFKGNSLVSADLFKKLMDVNKKLSGGGGTNRRISIKGGRFREIINGEQMRVNSSGSMNVVILDTSPIGRTYFASSYDPESPSGPTCWSEDSEKPSAEVSAENRKASVCRDCPMNIKGSGQGDSRACRFNARLAVAIEGDLGKVYQLQLPATSLFGGTDNKLGMQAYVRYLSANDTPVAGVVTTMYFDENSETPKLLFKPARPLEEDEVQTVLEAIQSEDVKKAISLSVYQQDTENDGGSKPFNPKKDTFEVDDEPAPAKAEANEEVEEPTRVAAKAEAPAAKTNTLNATLDAWG